MSLVALLFENKPQPNCRYQISSERVEFKQRAVWKGREQVLIATASININQPLSTFHTSTSASRGHRGHLPWPSLSLMMPIPRSQANWDWETNWAKCWKKVIAPFKRPSILSSGTSIKTDAAHSLLNVLYWFVLLTSWVGTIDNPSD